MRERDERERERRDVPVAGLSVSQVLWIYAICGDFNILKLNKHNKTKSNNSR